MADMKQLEKDLRSGRISRRDFIKASAMFGLAAAAPGILMGTAYANTPTAGGHFKLALGHGSTSDTLDPAKYENLYTQLVGKSIHNYLTEVRADGSLGPEIAESWEASPDAKTWTFQLRKGVEFHDGKPVTVNDVIASLNYHGGEDSQSGAKVIVDPMAEIKADGDQVLVITLKDGNADLPYQLSDYHLAIMPADADGKVTKKIAESGMGCGSYKLKNYDAGVKTELEKFANHWNDKEGHFETAEILSVKDVAARTNSLRTGEVDAIDRLDIKTLHLLERDKNIKIMETSGNAHYSMPMRCDTDPFKNNDVRLALKYCINREEMLETLLRGHGYVGNDHPIGRANRFLAKDMEQRTYDLDKAKHHLKKSGVDKLRVQLSAADAAFAGAVDAAVLYKEHAAKAGIEVEVVREPDDGYWSNVWMKKPWCMCYWGGRATEDWMFSTAYGSGAEWNDAFWENEGFDKLILEARSELDEAKRADMYAEAQAIVSNEGGTAIPVFNNFIFASSSKIGQPEQLGNDWDMDGQRAVVRWWKAA